MYIILFHISNYVCIRKRNEYGPDRQRWKTVLTREDGNNSVTPLRTVRYQDDVDIVTRGDTLYSLTYLDCGVLAVKDLTVGSVRYYQSCTDLLGSVTKVLKGDGTTVFKSVYDAWGSQTITKNDIGLIRGYTGHEMLPEFGLINMNGRMYDPLLGRFLSPDPYVQMPHSAQNYNRYSYCLNNPMKYVDPSGEIFGLGHLIVSGFGFVSGYISHALSSGDWGWKSLKSGLLSGASALIGYYMAGGTAAISAGTWKNVANVGFNELAGNFLPQKNVAIGTHFSMSFSPLIGFGDGGLSVGLGISASYHNSDFQLSLGAGMGSYYKALSLSASGNGWGLGYTRTWYSPSNFYGNSIGSQTVGMISVSGKDWNFNFSNDYLGDKKDRWRTFAAELMIDNYSIGVMAGTNDGEEDSKLVTPKNEIPFLSAKGPISGNYFKWRDGRVYVAPAWIGVCSENQITRIGINHEYIQDATQNVLHRLMDGTAKYYMDYNNLYTGLYSYRGAINPYSLWNH